MNDCATEKPAWLFFDLGSTLIDETSAYEQRIHETVDGSDMSVAAFTETASRLWSQGFDGFREACAFFHLQKAPWHSELEHPYEGCAAVLNALRMRGYRLGVIANQLPGTEQRLLRWNLLQYFDVVAASAERGVAKPDPRIFLWALRQAGCLSQNAVMIGDRIDNDILPAKVLGMQTVRILRGPFALFVPETDPADHTVDTLPDLLSVF